MTDENATTPAHLDQGIHVEGMFRSYFLEYASYVILDRAVPYLEDGLKPVQRRILHSMEELDDGRYNKAANIIGHTMKYHPHGDASINDAMVSLGQKDLLIDTQGNWGNVATGDSAAAPRYIEARLSKFAKAVLFSPNVTQWQASYDGRNKEPIAFPVKFPLLLQQGVEGIAVGLSTKVLPHNFIELLKASIKQLQGKRVELYPDFPTGGIADVSAYNDGRKGSRVRVRARIEIVDQRTLAIRQIPFGTTTGSLIESILTASDKGKIKIRKVEDNTARDVEILVHLPAGVSPDVTLDALYAFTDCEVSIAPNCCIIENGHPRFIGVTELLERATARTRDILRAELEFERAELEQKWHFASLEKIFIEKRIYRDIENCTTWESVLATIAEGLKPYTKKLRLPVTQDDIVRLTEIKIKRISKFDSHRADELLREIEDLLATNRHNLDHLTEYTIAWYQHLLDTFGKGRERSTELREFSAVVATRVAAANAKVYLNRAEGFIGTALKKDEFLCDCSDLDDLIVFRDDGTCTVIKVAEKAFVGAGIIWAGVWKRGDDRTIYHMVYRAGKTGPYFAKRFAVSGVTRDKAYNLAGGQANSKVLYFSANPQGEGEIVTVHLREMPRVRKSSFEFDFGQLAVKGRDVRGNVLTKHPIRKVEHKQRTGSTLAGIEIWFDTVEKRLNTEGRGMPVGSFSGDDRILVVYADGTYDMTSFDLSNHYQGNVLLFGKYVPGIVLSVVYYDGERQDYFVKRFEVEPTQQGKRINFVTEHPQTVVHFVSADALPRAQIQFKKEKGKEREAEDIELAGFIEVKGLKAVGNKLSRYPVRKVVGLESLPDPRAEQAPDVDEPEVDGDNLMLFDAAE